MDMQSSAGDDSDRIGLADTVRSLKPDRREVIGAIYFLGYVRWKAP